MGRPIRDDVIAARSDLRRVPPWAVVCVALVLAGCATTVRPRPPAGPPPEARAADVGARLTRRDAVPSSALPPPCRPRSRVLAVGASTLGATLEGPLRRGLAAHGIGLEVRARHSTSVVRPDYYDWLAELKRLIPRFHPEAVVISLGVNDNQPMRRGRELIPPTDPRWDRAFAERVDAYLDVASGPGHERAVIWIGPYAFRGRGSRVIGRRIHRILAERVAAFEGPASYVDVYSATLDDRGQPIVDYLPRGAVKRVRARGIDGVHLKTVVVVERMAEPTLAALSAFYDWRRCPSPRGRLRVR
ncbi:MAG: DUF459 domain-containing protein [Myxococcales bacterium]|nr:DUF459 domain-containing protein [Myxococcales bacterium]